MLKFCTFSQPCLNLEFLDLTARVPAYSTFSSLPLYLHCTFSRWILHLISTKFRDIKGGENFWQHKTNYAVYTKTKNICTTQLQACGLRFCIFTARKIHKEGATNSGTELQLYIRMDHSYILGHLQLWHHNIAQWGGIPWSRISELSLVTIYRVVCLRIRTSI